MIPFTLAEVEGTVGSRFERIAAALPEAPALADGERRWSYRELLDASEAYRQGFARLETALPAALVFGHGAESIIAMLGAIRAGVPVVPIDPHAPPEGLAACLAGCQLVVTEAGFAAWCAEPAGAVPVAVGPEGLRRCAVPAAAGPVPAPTAVSICVINLTSGSTGRAKGVLRDHRAQCFYIRHLSEHHGYGPGDRLAHLSSFAHGASLQVTLAALLTGAAIDVVDLRRGSAGALAEAIARRGVTILTLTPTLLRELTDVLAAGGGSWQPRLINVGGEALYPDDLRALRERLGWSCGIAHRLVSSEGLLIAEWRVELDRLEPDRLVPVGHPVAHREIALLDEAGRPVAPGEVGEIVVTGDYLARGYWNRPDLTAERFQPAPLPGRPHRQRLLTGDLGRFRPDGLLELLGRKDGMVKIRGFRVELAAVEAALRRLDGVADAAVLAERGARGGDRLLGYAQRAGDAPLTGPALRAGLGEHLPPYMVPRRILVLDRFPLTAGGKLDRRALPPPGRGRPDGLPPPVPPQGPTERLLAEIWAEALEIDAIGREDDFFALGGDSLDVLQVALLLQERLGRAFAETDLFGAADLAGMAEILDGWAGGTWPSGVGRGSDH